MRKKKIGMMRIAGKIDITDPCYDKDIWCRMDNIAVVPGNYTCYAWHHTDRDPDGGQKNSPTSYVGILGIYLNGIIPPQKSMSVIGEIGVDAGLAGFFHSPKPNYDNAAWQAICNKVTKSKADAWLTKDGVFASSGFGDGFYDVAVHRNKSGGIDAAEIIFIE